MTTHEVRVVDGEAVTLCGVSLSPPDDMVGATPFDVNCPDCLERMGEPDRRPGGDPDWYGDFLARGRWRPAR